MASSRNVLFFVTDHRSLKLKRTAFVSSSLTKHFAAVCNQPTWPSIKSFSCFKKPDLKPDFLLPPDQFDFICAISFLKFSGSLSSELESESLQSGFSSLSRKFTIAVFTFDCSSETRYLVLKYVALSFMSYLLNILQYLVVIICKTLIQNKLIY